MWKKRRRLLKLGPVIDVTEVSQMAKQLTLIFGRVRLRPDCAGRSGTDLAAAARTEPGPPGRKTFFY